MDDQCPPHNPMFNTRHADVSGFVGPEWWPLATNSVELNCGRVFAAKIESIFAAICQLPRLFLTCERKKKIVAERKI